MSPRDPATACHAQCQTQRGQVPFLSSPMGPPFPLGLRPALLFPAGPPLLFSPFWGLGLPLRLGLLSTPRHPIFAPTPLPAILISTLSQHTGPFLTFLHLHGLPQCVVLFPVSPHLLLTQARSCSHPSLCAVTACDPLCHHRACSETLCIH